MSSEPFKQENIINRFLRKSKVDSLKELRKVNEKWLYLDNKELERRSKWGQFKLVEFSKEHFQEDLQLFLKDTEANPDLFRSFRFEFRDAFKFLDASFFNIYRPQFLHLQFSDEFKFTQEAAQYLGNLLGWISEEIQELQVLVLDRFNNRVKGVLPAFFQVPLAFPNLKKFGYREFENHNRRLISCIQHFHCILNRSLEVDPAPKLTILEIRLENNDIRYNLEDIFGSDPTTPKTLSRWSKLNHLSFGSDSNLQRVSSMLRKMASAGMSLESFGLFLGPQEPGLDLVAICSDLTHFFRTQAEFLKILKISLYVGFDYEDLEPFDGIMWPIFKNVSVLQLKYSFFKIGPIPEHFPSLLDLELRVNFDKKILYPDGVPTSTIPTLYICIYWEDSTRDIIDARIDWYESKFDSVVHFKCGNEMVRIGQRELPWSDTLEVLEIEFVTCPKSIPIKVGYLTALKKLVINVYSGLRDLEMVWFEEALALNLSSITFKYSEDMPSNELKDAFSEYFPFPVEFQEIEDFD